MKLQVLFVGCAMLACVAAVPAQSAPTARDAALACQRSYYNVSRAVDQLYWLSPRDERDYLAHLSDSTNKAGDLLGAIFPATEPRLCSKDRIVALETLAVNLNAKLAARQAKVNHDRNEQIVVDVNKALADLPPGL